MYKETKTKLQQTSRWKEYARATSVNGEETMIQNSIPSENIFQTQRQNKNFCRRTKAGRIHHQQSFTAQGSSSCRKTMT